MITVKDDDLVARALFNKRDELTQQVDERSREYEAARRKASDAGVASHRKYTALESVKEHLEKVNKAIKALGLEEEKT